MGLNVIFEGPLDTLSVDPGADRAFTGEALDGWGKPGARKVSTAVHAGKRTGDLIGVVLDTIGWPAGKRSIDPGATLVPYWWADDTDAATAITDLVHSEGMPALVWVQGGVFYFRDRHHRATRAASITSQGTYTHIKPAGPTTGTDHKMLKGSFVYDHGLDYIVNAASLEVAPWIPGPRQVVWSATDPLSIGANEIRTIVVRTDDAFINMQSPVALVTYTEEGGAATYDYRLASGSVTFGLSRTSGQSTILTITAGGSGAFLPDGVKLRAAPLTQGAARLVTAADTASQRTYDVQDWDGAAPWAGVYDAQAIVDRIVAVYAQPTPSVTFQVDGAAGAGTLARILASQLSDRITVRNDEMGLNADFYIEQLTHTVKIMGTRHVLEIGAQVCEPYGAANPFTFDVAGKGFNDGQFDLSSANNPTTMFRFDVAGQGFNQGRFST